MDTISPKITRINRYSLSRNSREKRTPTQQWELFQALIVLSFATLIAGALLLVQSGWNPGHQDQVHAEFKQAQLRHDVKEWK
ncbi:MAG: hypothetical protein QOE26_2740 [Verrucomicrobiota bacterium]|jgi:hypothetical protein